MDRPRVILLQLTFAGGGYLSFKYRVKIQDSWSPEESTVYVNVFLDRL